MTNSNTTMQWQLGDSDTPSLDQLIVAFETACKQTNWLDISQLNDYTQPCVEAEITAMQAAAKAVGKDPETAIIALKPRLELLAGLYQTMQQQCISQRDGIAAELGGVNAGRSGVSQYAATSSL